MRFLLYNIRYATGPRMHNYMRSSRSNLDRIAEFMRSMEPDLIGLVEVVLVITDSEGRRLGDKFADTKVIEVQD